MRTLVLILVAVLTVACGDNDSPVRPTPVTTAPTPPPAPAPAPAPEPTPRPSASTCVRILDDFDVDTEAEPGGEDSFVILLWRIRNTCDDDVWSSESYELRGTAPNTPTWELDGTTRPGRTRANRTTRWRLTVPFTGRHRVTDYRIDATIRIRSASYNASQATDLRQGLKRLDNEGR